MKKETTWTIEKIKDGFEKFYEINKKYPTAYEIDNFSFLPSSRQIQRRFGGLVELRKILNLSIKNYTVGSSRSLVVSKINIRGRKYENLIFKLLKDNFDEEFIHIERPVNIENGYDSKARFDFMYMPNQKILQLTCLSQIIFGVYRTYLI